MNSDLQTAPSGAVFDCPHRRDAPFDHTCAHLITAARQQYAGSASQTPSKHDIM
jgi:hypothetical protein